MTIFGMDDSHYGEPLKARDGLDFYTHKLTDGDHFYEDAEYLAAMLAARNLGIPILGPYHVLHGKRSIESQARWLVARADALTPWWRDWPRSDWIWQIDAEPFSYLTRPTIAEVNDFGGWIVALSGSPVDSINGYCPAWAYSDAELRQLRYPWWPSNYGSNPAVPYRQAYPGDASTRWLGPIVPRFLQYGSRTIIAGQPTSDANAYRHTLAELRAEILGDDMAGDSVRFVNDQRPNSPAKGAVYITCGPLAYHLPDPAARDAALKLWGKTTADIVTVTTDAGFAAIGLDVEKLIPKSDDGGSGTRPPDFIVQLSGGLSGTMTGRAVPASEAAPPTTTTTVTQPQ